MGAEADVFYSCRILSGMGLNQMVLNQAPHRLGLVKKIWSRSPNYLDGFFSREKCGKSQ